MDKDNKLPEEIKNKSLIEKGKASMPNIIDMLKRTGKITGYTLASITLLEASAIATGPVAIATGIAFLGVTVKAGTNIIYKTEPSLMFLSKKSGEELKIFQDITKIFNHMNGYDEQEKAAMMGLQTLVGFQRYKENLKNTTFEFDENGNRLYSQKISTVTHGVNIKNLRALETLGYIKIDEEASRFRWNMAQDILHSKPKSLRSLLIPEKILFGNTRDLKKMAKFALKGDKENLDKMKQSFVKVSFRLTDKEINFEELYKKAQSLDGIDNKKEKYAIKRFGAIFSEKGILSTKNIGIKYDRFNRPIIDYKPKETFSKKFRRENPKFNFTKNKLDEYLKEGVDIEKVHEVEQKIQIEKDVKEDEKNQENR